MTQKEKPIVSWLIPTTLNRHRWWKRLVEFLEEDFPPDLIECVFLGTQDKGFAENAKKIGEKIANSLRFEKGVSERWKNVRFIEKYSKEFNISQSRNILLNEARGDILIYRDADTALIQYGFTKYASSILIKNKLGLLGFPSLKNGFHHKPEKEILENNFRFKNLILAPTVNGMATVMLKEILLYVGGWNTGLPRWGEHTALGTKLARAGFLLGYADNQGYRISTSDNDSFITLTDEKIDPRVIEERHVGIAMLNNFYQTRKTDIFYRIQRDRYKVFDKKRKQNVKTKMQERYPIFIKEQKLPLEKEKYNFKPWDCLSHADTKKYLLTARVITDPFLKPVLKRIKKLGLANHN